MNEELNKKIIEWVENATKMCEQELPPFIEEIATYGAWSNGLKALVALSVFMVFGWVIRLFFKEANKNGMNEGETIGAFVVLGIPSLLSILFFMDYADAFLKALCCPKLYVLQIFLK